MNQLLQLDYTALFRSIPGIYLVLSPDFTIVEVSDDYLASGSIQRESIVGKGLFDALPSNLKEKDIANLKASLNRVLHNKIPDAMAVEKYVVHRPGALPEEKYWSPKSKPILNQEGDVAFIIHYVEEVTSSVILAQQVSDKTSQILNIFERITDGFIALDKNFRYVYANAQVCKMIGKNADELIGKCVWDVFPDAVNSATYHAFHQAMNELHYISNIDYYPPLDLWQENHLYPSEDGLSVFIKDITLQKRAQIKIEKEKDFSDSIINSLPGVFYMFTEEGKMLRWNKNLEEVTGYSTEEITTMNPTSFFRGETKGHIASQMKVGIAQGFSSTEASFFTKDGKEIPFYFSSRRIFLDDEPCLLGTGINMAEKVKAEKELKESYEQIRALASHLQDVREEERTSIAREIHDELGQQLTGLKMDISWVNRKLDNDEVEIKQKIQGTLGLADEAVRTVRRIATELRPSILDDLGLVAALEWQSHEFEKRFGIPVSFTAGVSEVLLPRDVVTGLFRIYQESLTNVLRHAEANKITSSLTINGNTLILQIEDDGKGFDVSKAGNKKTLGLLGMKERTLIMGGDYEIKSTQGRGTIVFVSVPL